MFRTLQLSVPLLVCLLLTACSRPTGDGKADGTKAELAKAQAEIEGLRAELAKAKGGTGGEKSETHTVAASKKCLLNGGVVIFPDGKREPFTQMKGVNMSQGINGITIAYVNDIMMVTLPGESKRFLLDELASIKFGAYSKPQPPKYQASIEVEFTTVDRRKEKLIMRDFSSCSVKWKNKVGATIYGTAKTEELSGMSFTAEE